MKTTLEMRATIFLAILNILAIFALCNRPTVVECDAPHVTQEQIISVIIEHENRVLSTLGSIEVETENLSVSDSSDTPVAYPEEDIRYLAQLTIAESGNQTILGKRLVIDTVLNRVEHPNFPNTIREVINQTNQFSPVLSGSIHQYEPADEVVALIYEEIERRTDPDVIFFRAGDYGPYGVPMYKLGGHYFSSYD